MISIYLNVFYFNIHEHNGVLVLLGIIYGFFLVIRANDCAKRNKREAGPNFQQRVLAIAASYLLSL